MKLISALISTVCFLAGGTLAQSPVVLTVASARGFAIPADFSGLSFETGSQRPNRHGASGNLFSAAIAFHIDIGSIYDRVEGMKAYSLDLRERVVKFINKGGSRLEAARHFEIGERSVYRYLAAAAKGNLSPQKSWGTWRKLDPIRLQTHVQKHPDATLMEMRSELGVSHNAIWVRLNQLGITSKKTHKISRAQRSATVAFQARTRKTR